MWFYYDADDPRNFLLNGSPAAPGFLADVDRAYLGWPASVAYLAALWDAQGPFDGVLGFSQGAVMAHTLCWLPSRMAQTLPALARGREPWAQLKFAIFVAGNPSRMDAQREDVRHACTMRTDADGTVRKEEDATLALPSLHVSGARDAVVPPAHHRALAACFDGAELHEHDAARGHAVPQRAADRAAIVGFVRRALAAYPAQQEAVTAGGGGGGGGGGGRDEGVGGGAGAGVGGGGAGAADGASASPCPQTFRRGDGTLAHFFSVDEVRRVASAAGFVEPPRPPPDGGTAAGDLAEAAAAARLKYCCVRNVNRARCQAMRRVFVNGTFFKMRDDNF